MNQKKKRIDHIRNDTAFKYKIKDQYLMKPFFSSVYQIYSKYHNNELKRERERKN
jgi:hypothetical protein